MIERTLASMMASWAAVGSVRLWERSLTGAEFSAEEWIRWPVAGRIG
jgi:hypothetical protein